MGKITDQFFPPKSPSPTRKLRQVVDIVGQTGQDPPLSCNYRTWALKFHLSTVGQSIARLVRQVNYSPDGLCLQQNMPTISWAWKQNVQLLYEIGWNTTMQSIKISVWKMCVFTCRVLPYDQNMTVADCDSTYQHI